MWFDSEEETVEYLLKASLQPEQSSTGAWQLVLHRSLKVDPQAASFRQRSARLCNLQLPRRSLNVLDQAETAAADVRALVGASMAMLSSRQPVVHAPSQHQIPSQQPAVPQTPSAPTSQVNTTLCQSMLIAGWQCWLQGCTHDTGGLMTWCRLGVMLAPLCASDRCKLSPTHGMTPQTQPP